MTGTLIWKVLDSEATYQCLAASDVQSIREVLQSVDSQTGGKLLLREQWNEAGVNIVMDLLSHLILFAKAHQMSAEKTSTLVALVREVHLVSMEKRYTRVASYDHLRALMIQHSVPRPPFCAAIFDVTDVQDIDEYLLSTYYRHYKLYAYLFMKPQTLTVKSLTVEAITESPPPLPALSTAIPEEEWRTKMEERERGKEEARIEQFLKESEKLEEARRREAGLNNGDYSDGVKEQLESIRSAVQAKSLDRLDQIEQKLSEIEAQVKETGGGNKPMSKAGKKK
ncbi:hypothetical protein AGDE_01040 [Angomonas deanei]|nr:hypothetical protein AGDE_01040 [Angomonas deanei]|eukprot:EPY42883.1 hypothetical protein AGDE_01040 [Angomonas deanei]